MIHLVLTFLFIFVTAAFANQPSSQEQVAQILAPKLEQIRKSRLVYSWEIASVRDRMPNYCINECACLVRELQPVLIANGYETRVVTVRGRPRRGFGVQLQTHKGLSPNYSYHQVLNVKLDGMWSVIDPLAIGSALPEPYATWKARVVNSDSKVFEVRK